MKNQRKNIISNENTEYQDNFDIDCFTSRLKELLKDSGVSQKELAEKLEVKPLQISRWMGKQIKTEIPYKHIRKISRLFHVDEEWLYNPKHNVKNISDMIQNNIEVMDSMFYAQKKPLIEYLNSLGYEVLTTGGSYNDSDIFKNGHFNASIDHCVMKDGIVIASFDEKLEKRIALAVEYTLLK